MFTVQIENPSIEQYVKSIGKEEVEKLFLSFLEIKSKLNQLPNQQEDGDTENFKKAQEFGISLELHRKILALKSTHEKEVQEMRKLREEIHGQLKEKYPNISTSDLRDEYFQSKGYL